MPQPVKIFLSLIFLGSLLALVIYLIRKYSLLQLCKNLLEGNLRSALSNASKDKIKKSRKTRTSIPINNKDWRGESDQDVLERLVETNAQADLFGERSGQRTLAAVVKVAKIEGRNVLVTFKDVATEELLTPGTEIKCVFEELVKGEKKVNAFVGVIKSISPDKGAVITRKSSFGFIRRRVHARRKIKDQRYIKIKIWRLEDEEFNVEHMLDKVKPDMIIDNRINLSSRTTKPHVVDISKGGLALIGDIQEGGNTIDRNDRVLLAMIIYLPNSKRFQPHLIYAETRAARSMGISMTRFSFQFLRSLEVPPRKRSTLFKGQAVMAMNIANPE